MRKPFLTAIVIALLTFASAHPADGGQNLPEVVGIVTVPENVRITAELNGRAVAFLTAEVRPQVNGIILERLFEEGSTVQENMPLYQIDPAMYEAQLASAEAGLTKAKANAELAQVKEQRYDSLLQSSAVSKEDYDEVYAGWKQAESEVGMAEAAVKIAQITS